MTKKTEANEAAEPKVQSEAEKIWDEIKDKPIEMFGLPDQVVAMHCSVINIDPEVLYLVARSSAVLPSLEASVHPKFTVEMADKYILVKRAAKPLVPAKRR